MSTATTIPARTVYVPLAVAGIVLVWFVLAEIGTHIWYATHESQLTPNPVPETGEEVLKKAGKFAMVTGRDLSQQGIGDSAMGILKCSYGRTLMWRTYAGSMSAVTVLKWDQRSVVGGVEAMHNPGNCLRAAGWSVGTKMSLGVQNYCGVTCEVTKWDVSRDDLPMQAYSAVFRRYSETETAYTGRRYRYDTRLESVLAGRRDAPVMIFLAYLPVESSPAITDARFRRLMKALFCEPDKQ